MATVRGPSPGAQRERLVSDLRVLDADGIKRAAWAWDRHERQGLEAYHAAERAALAAIEAADLGPSWEEFTRAMGIDKDSASSTAGSVYSVSYYRPAPGHREQLEKMLSETPSAPNDTTAGNVLMQHLEGAGWTFLSIARYNSWDDFATGEKNSVAQTTKKDSPWFRLRDHTDFHTDTLTDRIAP